MDTRRWQRIDELFSAAVSCPPAERNGLLASGCGDDSVLRGEVEGLLAAHDCASAFIELPAFELSQRRPAEAAAAFSPGQRLGQYTVRGVLGVGGMGVVYEADQEHPQRTVALKVIRPGIATPALLRRFEHEANILARLQHPGIAQVFDAAAADSPFGRLPFFAMELVAGESITAFADMRGLSIAARVELLAGVCDAVQHAHQKGVIHRDLKPSNILVTSEGRAKVLDFGVARIADPAVAPVTIQTEIGQIVGTFAYMSPEQVSGERDAIDTRSDVYSLGVIGYELLTGRLPFDLAGKNLVEAARIIRDVPPPRPASLRPDLGSDLDIILRHALEKSPARRYPSAAELAADLRRVLDRRPILARPPSVSYQFRKWITRNRVVFTLGSAMLVLIIGSAITTAWLAVRYARQRDEALAAKTRESQERDTAEQTAAFLAKLFEHADPGKQTAAAAPTARDLLDAGVVRLETELTDKPLVRARLLTKIGVVYGRLADYPKALKLLRSAVEIVRQERPADHPDLIEPLVGLADALGRAGNQDEGHEALLECLQICERQYGPQSERVAEALTGLGRARFYAADYPAALDYFQRTLVLQRQLFGPENEAVSAELTNIGATLKQLRRFDEAESALRESMELKKRLGSDPFSVGQTLEALAHVAMGRNDPAAAENYLTEQIKQYRLAFHDRHPQIAFAMHNLAFIVEKNRGAAAAEPIYRETIERRLDLFGEQHPDVALTLNNFAANQAAQGKLDDAIALHTRALNARRGLWGPRHSLVGGSLQALGETYRRAGRLDEAEPVLLESYDIIAANHGPVSQQAIPPVGSLTSLYRTLERPEQTAYWLEILGDCHSTAKQCPEAAEAYREALEIHERLFGPDDERTIASRAQLLTTE